MIQGISLLAGLVLLCFGCVLARAASLRSSVGAPVAVAPRELAGSCESPKVDFSVNYKWTVDLGTWDVKILREDGSTLYQKSDTAPKSFCEAPQKFTVTMTHSMNSTKVIGGMWMYISYRGFRVVTENALTSKTWSFYLKNYMDLSQPFRTFQSDPASSQWMNGDNYDTLPVDHYPFQDRVDGIVTKYYLTKFNYNKVESPDVAVMIMGVTFDSGMAFYLNGERMTSINLDYPVSGHSNKALTCRPAAYYNITFPVDHLRIGENILAFEVHKCNEVGYQEDFFGVQSLVLAYGHKKCTMYIQMNSDPDSSTCLNPCYNTSPYDERGHKLMDDDPSSKAFMLNHPSINIDSYFSFRCPEYTYYSFAGLQFTFGEDPLNRHFVKYSITGEADNSELVLTSPVYSRPGYFPFAWITYRNYYMHTYQSYNRWRFSNLTSVNQQSISQQEGVALTGVHTYGCTHSCLAEGNWPTTPVNQIATIPCPGSSKLFMTRPCEGSFGGDIVWGNPITNDCPAFCYDEGDGFGEGEIGSTKELLCADRGAKTKECSDGGVWKPIVLNDCVESMPRSLTYGDNNVIYLPAGIFTTIIPTIDGFSFEDYSFFLPSGVAIPGMNLDPMTGVLFGAPIAVSGTDTGIYDITLKAGSVIRKITLSLTIFTFSCPTENGYEKAAGGEYSAIGKDCSLQDGSLGKVDSFCRGDVYPPKRTQENNCYTTYPKSFSYPTPLLLPVGYEAHVEPIIFPKREKVSDFDPQFTGMLKSGLDLNPNTGVIYGVPQDEQNATSHNITITLSNGVTVTTTVEISYYDPACIDENDGFGSIAPDMVAYQDCLDQQLGKYYKKCLKTNPPTWSPTYRTCAYPAATISYTQTSYDLGRGKVANIPAAITNVPFQRIVIVPNDFELYSLKFDPYTGAILGTSSRLMEPTVYQVTAYNELQQPSNTVNLTISIKEIACLEEEGFTDAVPLGYGTRACPEGQSGTQRRFCSSDGKWDKTTNSSDGKVVNGIDSSACRYHDPILLYSQIRYNMYVGVYMKIVPTNTSYTTRMFVNSTDRPAPEGLIFNPENGEFSGTPTTEYKERPTRIFYYNVANSSKEQTLFFTSSSVFCLDDTLDGWKQTVVGSRDAKFCESGKSGIISRQCNLVIENEVSLGRWADPETTCRDPLLSPTVDDTYVASSIVVVLGSAGASLTAFQYFCIQNASITITSTSFVTAYFTLDSGSGGSASNVATIIMRLKSSPEKKDEDLARLNALTNEGLLETIMETDHSFPYKIAISGPRTETGKPPEVKSKEPMSTGAVVGIAVGAAVVVVAIVVTICCIRENRHKAKNSNRRANSRGSGRGGRGGRGSTRGGARGRGAPARGGGAPARGGASGRGGASARGAAVAKGRGSARGRGGSTRR